MELVIPAGVAGFLLRADFWRAGHGAEGSQQPVNPVSISSSTLPYFFFLFAAGKCLELAFFPFFAIIFFIASVSME